VSYLNRPDDGAVECLEVFSRYPIFEMCMATSLLHRILRKKLTSHGKTGDKARSAHSNVPIAGNLDRVVFGEHRIEDRLFWKAGWKSPHVRLPDQLKFLWADWPPKNDCFCAMQHG